MVWMGTDHAELCQAAIMAPMDSKRNRDPEGLKAHEGLEHLINGIGGWRLRCWWRMRPGQRQGRMRRRRLHPGPGHQACQRPGPGPGTGSQP